MLTEESFPPEAREACGVQNNRDKPIDGPVKEPLALKRMSTEQQQMNRMSEREIKMKNNERKTFLSERDPAQEPVRKKQRGRGSRRSPPREASPVLFSHPDQHPTTAASNLVSFGGNEDNTMDDSMSLTASNDPTPSIC
ncbi:hypothetical protein Q8A67_010059 [Cirrhinus molitorella]|uniref:Uncharacterized protein n=1 Tax=Cirrhinus molitorella TaxID=172907 RepID=A0AA88Q3E0_9TELE|nr:hypothetical protein Q8A67_010059 [Cirrhinus molitorella]